MIPTHTIVGGQRCRLPMMWIGQSVDTSILHVTVPEFRDLPVLTSLGCAIRRPSLLARRFGPNLKATLNVSGPLMLDSGGFSMMKNKASNWSAEDVSAVYHRVDADIVVSLDIPPGLNDRRSARAVKLDRTLNNLAILAPRFGPRLMPVVQGRTPQEVIECCEGIAKRLASPEWLGIGGLVPLLQRSGSYRIPGRDTPQAKIATTLQIVRAHFPKSILHVFGVGSIQTMLALFSLGAQSADSIGWRQAAGFGSIYLPGQNQRLLSWKSKSVQPRPLIDAADRALLAECNCPVCRPIELLQYRIRRLNGGFTQRSLHNLWVLGREIDSLIAAQKGRREMEFLSTRLSAPWLATISESRAGLNFSPVSSPSAVHDLARSNTSDRQRSGAKRISK
jgi:tRNA-guanine family transglycosylase